jgi:ABC-2 type transport system ATP-binding protein
MCSTSTMSGLDPAARVAVKAAARALSADGRTLFFTSHVLADVDELCSSIAVLDRAAPALSRQPAGAAQTVMPKRTWNVPS